MLPGIVDNRRGGARGGRGGSTMLGPKGTLRDCFSCLGGALEGAWGSKEQTGTKKNPKGHRIVAKRGTKREPKGNQHGATKKMISKKAHEILTKLRGRFLPISRSMFKPKLCKFYVIKREKRQMLDHRKSLFYLIKKQGLRGLGGLERYKRYTNIGMQIRIGS